MATIYVWQKYDAVTKYSEPEWGMPTYSGYCGGSGTSASGYTSYSLDTTNGIYIVSNYATFAYSDLVMGKTLYSVSTDGKTLNRSSFSDATTTGNPQINVSTYSKGVTNEGRTYGGTNYGSVTSTDNSTYPSFGEQDGYWYIYITSYTIPDFKVYVNVGGVAKEASAVYVNVDGVAKTLNNLYCNIGGVAKKYRQPNFTNQLPISTDTDGSIFNGKGYMENQRLTSSTGVIEGYNGSYVTGFIPYKYGDTAYLKNVTFQKGITTGITSSLQRICFYDANKTFIGLVTATGAAGNFDDETFDDNGVLTSFKTSGVTNVTNIANVAYFRLNGTYIGDDSIITVNEEITYAN